MCSRCKQEKPKSEFHKRKDTACGVGPRCKPCQRAYHDSRKEKNEEYRVANRRVRLQKNAIYYSEKREALLAQKKEYYIRKRDEILAKRKVDQPKTNARVSQRSAENPTLKLGKLLKARIQHAARTMGQKIISGRQLRADRDKIRQRLEVNFQPGMSWANYGKWHIDHVKPLAAFVAQGRDVSQANLLCNLRPMWGRENMLKSATFKGRYYRYTTGAEK